MRSLKLVLLLKIFRPPTSVFTPPRSSILRAAVTSAVVHPPRPREDALEHAVAPPVPLQLEPSFLHDVPRVDVVALSRLNQVTHPSTFATALVGTFLYAGYIRPHTP